MFEFLTEINRKPRSFEFYTAKTLWNDKHISRKILDFHLSQDTELASRNKLFIDLSVEWMCSKFNIGSKTRLADFGCGPGLYTSAFAQTGAFVTGVDFSENSISYAKTNDPENKIDYVLCDYLEYESEKKFDIITMIYCDLCALSPAQRKKLFKKFYRYLADDGVLLLDVFSLNFFNKKKEEISYGYNFMEGFWSKNNYYAFLNTFKYEKEKVTLDKYTVIEKNRALRVYNWLQCYDKDSIAEEFKNNGFQIIEYYSDLTGKPYKNGIDDFAVCAKKI